MTRTSILFPAAAFGLSLLSSGCATSTAVSRLPADEGSFCARQSQGVNADGDSVVVCEQTFAQRPFVHVPASKFSTHGVLAWKKNEIEFIGGMLPYTRGGGVVSEAISFVTPEGKMLVPLGANGNPVEMRRADAASQLPDSDKISLRIPSNRYSFTLYRIVAELGRVRMDLAGNEYQEVKLKSATPAVMLTGCAIDSVLLGVWEGTVSGRVDEDVFDENERIPVRFKFSRLERQKENLSAWEFDGPRLKDGSVYTLHGQVENLAKKIVADGKEFPDLLSLRERNPFLGATENLIELYRMTSMHMAGDNVVVLVYPKDTKGLTSSGMTGDIALLPGALIQAKPAPDLNTLSIIPHGFPFNQRIKIQPVAIGNLAGTCTN